MQRISEKPIQIDVTSYWPKFMYNEDRMAQLASENRVLKGILRLLHVHPCYLQNLFDAADDGS